MRRKAAKAAKKKVVRRSGLKVLKAQLAAQAERFEIETQARQTVLKQALQDRHRVVREIYDLANMARDFRMRVDALIAVLESIPYNMASHDRINVGPGGADR